MPYNKSGPFTNNNPPAYNAAFGNNLENYLNPGQSRNGVPLMSWFGPYTVTITPTFFAHNLKDSNGSNVTPDLVLIVTNGTSNTVHNVTADLGSMTNTQVKLTSDGIITTNGIALKF